MKELTNSLKRTMPQPLTAIILCGLALAAWLWTWLTHAPNLGASLDSQSILLTLVLAVGIMLAGRYPVHIRYHAKIYLTTPPIYLLAVLIAPPLASLAVAISILALQLMTRAKRGNLPSDIVTATSRWLLVVLVAGLVAHLPSSGAVSQSLVLLGTALVMFVGDVATAALEIAPMSGEPPLLIMKALLRDGGLFEGVQYLLGMLGAFAAFQNTWAIVLLILPTSIVYLAFKNVKEMHDGTRKMLEGMADAVDLRDPYTGGHSRRVSELCGQILKEMNILGPEAELIKAAARVHDIGKIGVPDDILNKPGRLTPAEKKIMDSHAVRGAELLARYPDFARGVAIVRHHHESWDGGGYPSGLREMEIPFGSRVIAVADSFDAMTTNRPYRAALSTTQALRVLREGRGQQWDAQVVDAFLSYVERSQGEAQREPRGAAVNQVFAASA